VFESRWPRAVA